MKAIAIVSGGMDSVTLAYYLVRDLGADLTCLSFDYGQRHVRELGYAEEAASALGVPWHRVDLHSLAPLLAGSALTSPEVAVPEGHYAAPTMALTVVPNRNAIMLAIAYGLAVSTQAQMVATAIHAGDHPVYPDCRPEFAFAFQRMERLATEGHADPNLHLFTPFLHDAKAAIVEVGESVGVPWAHTWSCYLGGPEHCGRCSTCVERQEAFAAAGVIDPTHYTDPTYWQTVEAPTPA